MREMHQPSLPTRAPAAVRSLVGIGVGAGGGAVGGMEGGEWLGGSLG